MPIPFYLAMTAAEFASCEALPHRYGWMACHFSPYGLGLSNIPEHISETALLIVNDRTPIFGHDPAVILSQLKQTGCSRLLLDFQRPGVPETAKLAELLINEMSCPVGVSLPYAADRNSPVFLPPVPPYMTVDEYLAPFQECELWLEVSLEAAEISVTKQGCHYTSLPCQSEGNFPHHDAQLHCTYRMEIQKNMAKFTLNRSVADLAALLEASEAYGVTQAIGLYQQFKNYEDQNAGIFQN